MLARNHQHVPWCDRGQIHERQHQVVGVDQAVWGLAVADQTEHARVHGRLVSFCRGGLSVAPYAASVIPISQLWSGPRHLQLSCLTQTVTRACPTDHVNTRLWRWTE